jgi:hypothetical protein
MLNEVFMTTAVILNTDQMGHGDPKLGLKILGACLRKLANFPDLRTIVLYNNGVKLATNDSPMAVELRELQNQGVDILPCGTCAEHYGVKDKLITDHPCGMDDILAALRDVDKVITL